MIRRFPLAAAAVLLLGASGAMAEPKPYEAVTVTYDKTGSDDAGLKTFIESLQAAVAAGDVETLKAAVPGGLKIYSPLIGFPEEKPQPALRNPEDHPGQERLDQAAILTTSSEADYSREDLDSLIVDLFGMALEPATVGTSKIAEGALCSPAEPVFDRAKALAIADAADVPAGNLWVLSEKTDFHEKPDAASPVVEALPAGSIVPFLQGSVAAEGADEGDEDWYSVALPSGKTGYGANDDSLSFQSVAICYGKVDEQWAVTAVIVPRL